MTVNEMIEILKTMPENAEIINAEHTEWDEILKVYEIYLTASGDVALHFDT